MADWKWWLAAAVLVLVAAVAVSAVVIGQLPFPKWAQSLVAGVAVVASLFISPLHDKATSWLKRPDALRKALLDCTRLHDRKGRLRKVRDCRNPVELGVHPASPPAAMPPSRALTTVRRIGSDPAHVAAARAMRRDRVTALRRSPEPEVQVRALADYDAALGVDGGVA